MIIKFSKKIVQKEWRKLVLPFLSIFLTGAVIATSYLLIDSAREFITSKNKEFLGGDISYSSAQKYDASKLFAGQEDKVELVSKQITFSGLVSTSALVDEQKVVKSSGASFKIIDENYPLYGNVSLQASQFDKLKPDEVYVDENLYKSLGQPVLVEFNDAVYIIKDVIKSSPESLLAGFSFGGGSILMSFEGVERSEANLDLFRKDYVTKVKLSEKLRDKEIESLKQIARDNNVRGQFDGSGQGGIALGLDIVERFLIITILIIAILSLVNIYASVNYLSNRLRRPFSILIAIGLNINSIYKILFLINATVIFAGTILGISAGYYIAKYIEVLVEMQFKVSMFLQVNYLEMFYMFLMIFVTSIFATLPVINRLRNITPRDLLSHNSNSENKKTFKNVLFDIVLGIFPITILAIVFLDSYLYGLLAIVSIVCVYGSLMIFYYFFVNIVYKYRNIFSFSLRLITAQKKFDGFLGLITFASLFVALTSVYNLSILRSSIEDYLKDDLTRSLPSTYVLDIQKSQKDDLLVNFPELTLFPNVRARLIEIDGKDIQKALENGDTDVDRELSREFNLSYRDYLLPNEKLIDATDKALLKELALKKGEVSLEKSFAERVNIKLGSELKFLIQGFEINSKVVSIREADTRSGYPFFFFIFSPEELENFPATFFGYANFNNVEQEKIKSYLADNIPNANIIDTGAITKLGEELIGVLLLIILIITIPPIVLSSMLIITILASLSNDRKRDGARIMAIGKENSYVRNFYILESTSTVILASGFAYVFAVIVANLVVIYFLKIENLIYFDLISFFIFISILIGMTIISFVLWRKGKKSLKEYLNYEENN